jgi:hypothetical protein
MSLDHLETLRNPKTGEVRVVFSTSHSTTHVVVKFFDPVQLEKHTFKVFSADMYSKVRNHWRSLTPYENKGIVREAFQVIVYLNSFIHDELYTDNYRDL